MIRNGYYTLLVQNGKDQIGKDFEKGDEKIDPKDEEDKKDEEQEEPIEEESETPMPYDETENENDDVGAGQYGGESASGSKMDAMWLIILFAIVIVTVVLFIIIFAKKRKNEDGEKSKKEKKTKVKASKKEDSIPEIDLDILAELRNEMPAPVPNEIPKDDGLEEVSVEDHFK